MIEDMLFESSKLIVVEWIFANVSTEEWHVNTNQNV